MKNAEWKRIYRGVKEAGDKRCHSEEPFGYTQDKLRDEESEYVAPGEHFYRLGTSGTGTKKVTVISDCRMSRNRVLCNP